MVFFANAFGHATFIGENWTELTSLSMAEARDFGWIRALHPEDREYVRQLVLEAIKKQCGFTLLCRIVLPDGDCVWVAAGADTSFGPPGNTFLGFLGSAAPLTEVPAGTTQASGRLKTSNVPYEPGSALDHAADHLLAAHRIVTAAGSRATRTALEATLYRLGQDLAGEIQTPVKYH